ncbi:MAG: hypothetical protein KBF37_05070 [Saprospiraceae bacterium]|jgi:hypothetical protein|nr:hypothetical protein [Saprospiraceae bacterium]MBP9209680.1 hypothetical protein [Saprospiraceae bacterium]MBV6471959.1 hypothetical protein [Saprospiraceae bacterium]
MKKRFFIFLAGAFVIILAAAVAIPFFFSDAVAAKVKNSINSNINGKLDFSDFKLSLFSDFPYLSLHLENPACYSFVGSDTTELFRSKSVRVSVNAWNVLLGKEKLVVKGLYIESAMVNLVQYDSLHANYMLINGAESTAEPKSSMMDFSLEDFTIVGSSIRWESMPDNILLVVRGLNHTGSIAQISGDQEVHSELKIDSFTVTSGLFTILNEAKIASDSHIKIKDQGTRYDIGDSKIQLNSFLLKYQGSVEMKGDSLLLGLRFESPGTQFKELFSLLPNAYTADFERAVSSGSFSFKGAVDGLYLPDGRSYPGWNVAIGVDEGAFIYPGKSMGISNVKVRVLSRNTQRDMSDAFISVDTAVFLLNRDLVTARLYADKLAADPHFRGDINGRLDLVHFGEFYPLDPGTVLEGRLDLDLKFDARQSAIELERYNELLFHGFLKCNGIRYTQPGMPALSVPVAQVDFQPSKLSIDNANLIFGKSDFAVSGSMRNPLAVMSGNSLVEMNLTHRSEKIDADELMGVSDAPSASAPTSINTDLFDRLSVDFNSTIRELNFETYSCTNIRGSGQLKGNALRIAPVEATVNGSTLTGNVTFENILDFSLDTFPLRGIVNFESTMIDLDKLMGTGGQIAASSNGSFALPSGFDLDIRGRANKVIYSPLQLNEVLLSSKLSGQRFIMEKITAKAAGGQMTLQGLFETPPGQSPVFDLKYDINRLEFKKAFESFSTLSVIAPLFRYIEGFFNSSLIFQGKLAPSGLPDFNSLSVNGLIETLEGSIKGFEPLKRIAEKTGLREIGNLNIANSRNWFNIDQGIVQVKEFDKKIGDIRLEVEGTHRISGPMDYEILIDLPQGKTSQYLKAARIDEGMQLYNEFMAKAGLNKTLSAELDLLIGLKGTVLSPDVRVRLQPAGDSKNGSSKDGLADVVKEKLVDSLKSEATAVREKVETAVEDKVRAVSDSLEDIARKKLEQAKEDLESKVRQKIDTLVGSKASDALKKPMDSLTGKILKEPGKAVDSIKTKLKDWNPFKKEKK